MFFVINKIEQAVHRTDNLQNPKTPGNAMLLGIYRNKVRTALYTMYTKKTFGEYWDEVENKKIPKRLWTPEMHAFYTHKAKEAPRPPFIFKATIIGWIFLLLVISVFGLLIYEGVKPPIPKTAEHVAMEKLPVTGDIYFGHYETYKEKGNPLGVKIGYGWFKIVKIEDDTYFVAKSTEMSKSHQPKEQLNSAHFEADGIPLKLEEQTGYNLRLKSADGLTEVYITDKK